MRETEVLAENMPQRRFVHHKSYMTSLWLEPGSNGGKLSRTDVSLKVTKLKEVTWNTIWRLRGWVLCHDQCFVKYSLTESAVRASAVPRFRIHCPGTVLALRDEPAATEVQKMCG
jgi:hypothetical protein